jgi:hypothetical protein
MGKTPLVVTTEPGERTIEMKQDGYQDFKQTLRVEPYVKNRISAELRRLVTLKIAVSPPAARVEVDGKFLGGEQETTYQNIDDALELSIVLPSGSHRIEVSHLQAAQTLRRDITIDGSSTEVREEIRLPLDPAYRAQLKLDYDLIEYEAKLSSWRFKYRFALVASLLAAGYSYQQNTEAQTARTEMETEVTAMLAAASLEDARAHDAKAAEQNDKIKQSNSASQSGAVLSAVLFGLAAWIWINEPPKPTGISQLNRPTADPEPFALIPVMTSQGSIGLAWQRKW